ncbi:MAG: class I SAM-dependent RNA methyltransferase [Actinomycetota bacterium]|nr:class I SAM-dependent RNA methyltransferase [Actinomycetota bacterium]
MTPDLVGEVVDLEVDAIAHGGHCVGRHEGRVVFVRHALPGELVRARITEGGEASSYLRADAVEILRAAPGRVEPRCPVTGPGGCGGCDFQHVDLATQRALLGDVVREQLRRLAGIEYDVSVEAVDGGDGLGWRTRVEFSVDPHQRLGLRRHRSHDVVPVDPCPIAHPALADFTEHRWDAERVEAVVSSRGERLAVVEGPGPRLPRLDLTGVVDARGKRIGGRTYVHEQVRDREFRVSAGGFWQVHPAAPTVLVDAVLELAAIQPGERVVDLYAGVGLLTAFLADATGPRGVVHGVEANQRAARDARRNLHDLSQVRLVHAPVETALRRGLVERPCDAVVLDPPRTGARSRVVKAVAELAPSRIVYVACDPAVLARDIATFVTEGYELTRLRAFDLFPMTHHVECVALLVRDGA